MWGEAAAHGSLNGRGGLSQPDPLQQARQGRALRGLGAARAVRLRGPRRVALASLDVGFRAGAACPRLAGRPSVSTLSRSAPLELAAAASRSATASAP